MAASRTDPIALITGGTSGIGFALAREFGRNGYRLVLCADDPASLQTAVNVLAADGLDNVTPIVVDLATRAGVEQLHAAAASIGPIDVLVANAGIGSYGLYPEGVDLEDDLRAIQLNVLSVVHLTGLVSEEMAARGSGKILITASIMAFLPDPFQTVYAASRAFTYVFAEGLRDALRQRGVTVTVLLPGFTRTPFFGKTGADRSRAVQGVLMRMGDPAKVARAAYRALERGDDQIIPGRINRLIAIAGKLAPDPTITRIVHRMLEPVSGEERG